MYVGKRSGVDRPFDARRLISPVGRPANVQAARAIARVVGGTRAWNVIGACYDRRRARGASATG